MKLKLSGLLLGFFLVAVLARADEGMWVFNNLPKKVLKEKHGFEVTEAWSEKVMKASVRFSSGGSGSFVSANGLVITNHHVASDTLKKLSSPGKNILEDGYFAATPADELKVPDLELNQLLSIEDVTAKVNSVIKPDMTAEAAAQARRAMIAQIEKESFEKTGLRSNVITLYQGGEYHLYRFKRYTDVRLVFAPEKAIAFFGGDPDNFEYPRYDLDVTFFRVYENNVPVKVDHYLNWSKSGTKDGELIFVSGNPGRTSRQLTEAAVRSLRDTQIPQVLEYLARLEVILQVYMGKGEKQKQHAQDDLFGVANSRKVYLGRIAGLQDPGFILQKQEEEMDLKAFALASPDPEIQKAAGAWDTIRETAARYTPALYWRYALLERGWAFNSTLFTYARHLVRMAKEDLKSNEKRLPEYRDSSRETLKLELYSAAPLDKEYEQYLLAQGLSLMVQKLGATNRLVRDLLQGKSPEERAAEVIGKTKLHQISTRQYFGEAKPKARLQLINASEDPLIQLALLVDDAARGVRKQVETKITEPQLQAYAQIAKVRFAKYGNSTYPDATFSLRLSFGTVEGYEDGGQNIAPYTTLGGAFEHETAHGAKDPYKLPESWHRAKGKLDLSTPFNFVSTADIIGGNSGSPVINRDAEFVGIIFDGNIHSLTADYFYSDRKSRAVSVDARGILESLRHVYEATALVDELSR